MGNQALYLKWRPQDFADVIGQEHITTTLLNSLRQNRIRHAYLFSGPRGTGKTSTARLLAKAVGTRNFDLIEIDAASNTGVDDVRELKDRVAFAPSESQYKVYIIDEVHRFSGSAFDALLKTLEEPPAHVIFVLATTELDKVPATIKSRCLLFDFRRVSVRQVVERLRFICDQEGISIDDAALELIARQGTGSVRDSISLLDQIVADPDTHVTLELAQQMLGAVGTQSVHHIVQAVLEQNTAEALDQLNQAMDLGADPRQLGQQIVDHLRNMMLVQVGGAEVVDASNEMRAVLAQQSAQIGRRTLLKAVRKFSDAIKDMRGGWQPQLGLELAIVESTTPEDEPLPVMQAPARQAPVVAATPATPAPQPEAAPPKQEKPAPPKTAPMIEQSDKALQARIGSVSLADIRRGWEALIDTRRLHRTALQPMIKQFCMPLEIQDGVLVVGVQNEMLINRVENSQELFENALADVFGEPIPIRIQSTEQAMSNSADEELEQIAKEHGGTISDA